MAQAARGNKNCLIEDEPFVEDGLTTSKNPLRIVDLFAGIGGFHYGIAAAAKRYRRSVEPILVSEIEESCRETYEKNHHVPVEGDINKIDLSQFTGTADILTAGFPCQPFSNSGKKKGLKDPRGRFYFKITEMIEHFEAKSFILENVPGIRSNGGGRYESRLALDSNQVVGRSMHILEKQLSKLENYEIRWVELDSSKLGSPQVRKRVYIIGVRKDFLLESSFELHFGDYAPRDFFSVMESDAPSSLNFSAKQEANLKSFMNRAPSYKDGMRRVGQAYLCPGGNVGQGYHAAGKVPTLTKVWARFLPIYFPADGETRPTLDDQDFAPDETYGNGTFRRASVREVMRLQGFPNSFEPHPRDRIAYEHAGNAVNAKTIKEIASNLLRYINN